jgi:hypothetical protein
MRTTLIAGAILIFLIVLFSAIIRSDKPLDKPNTAIIEGREYDIIKYVIDTHYVPKVSIKTIKGSVILKDTVIYKTITEKVDTMSILKDYFATKVFVDTLRIDSMGYVSVRDTISENAIVGRQYTSKLNMMIVNKNVIVKEPKRAQLHAGFGVSFDKVNLVNSLQGNILIKTKKDRIISIGAGIDHTATPFLNSSIYWKIR